MGDDEIGGLGEERAVVVAAARGGEVEGDAAVHAALAEVPVQGGLVVEAVQQGAERAQVRAEPGRRDGGVLPARQPLRAAGEVGGGAERALARAPDAALLGGIGQNGGAGAGAAEVALAVARGAGGLGGARARELGQQPAVAGGEAVQVAEQGRVHALQPGRPVPEHLADVVGGDGDVREAEHGQRPVGGLLDERDRRLQDRDQRALAADQRAGDVQPALGQQLVEVVAGHAAREVGEAGADRVRVAVAQGAQGGVDGRRGAVAAHRRAGAVVEQDVERVGVVGGAPGGERVHAAGVVAEHAAERRHGVRRGVRAEGQPVRRRGGGEVVADDPGLHRAPGVRAGPRPARP